MNTSPADRHPASVRVEGLNKHFGGVYAVNDVSVSFQPGILTSVIGPNGAGKSTLFNLICGSLRPSAGRVFIDDVDVTRWSDQRRARTGLARTFQAARVLQRMSVLDNLVLAGRDQPGEHLSSVVLRGRAVRRRDNELRERAEAVLADLSMTRLRDDYASSLSGGQRKLLEFGRLLMAEPKLVLLDEPLAGINPALGEQLMDRICALRDLGEITFLLIEHDLETVMSVSDHVVVMATGQLLIEGTPDEVRADSRVIDAYLGVAHSGTDGAGQ